MTDQHFKLFKLFNLPDEILQYTAQYLTIPQLALFKQVCKKFNNPIGIQAEFVNLHTIYNRLYKLDPTIAPVLSRTNAPLQYAKAISKIAARQKAELIF